MVDLMIILFHLKLDKFFCTGVMNQLKVICYDFFCSYKNSYFLFNRQELLEKAKDRNHNGGGKNETGKYYIENTDVVIVKANSKHKNLSEEKKEQKENIREIGTKT